MPRPRQPSSRRSSRRANPIARQLRFDLPADDPDDPQPGPSGVQAIAAPAAVAVGDSDWELSDDDDGDTTYRPPVGEEPISEDSSSGDEPDHYVSLHDSSIDSDTPLATLRLDRNVPGGDRWAWRKKPNVPLRYGFQGHPGVKADLDVHSTPRQVFDAFFTDALWEVMVKETNAYAVQNPPTPSRKMVPWTPVSKEELQSYLGLRILMGVQPRPDYRDYWSKECDLGAEGVY